ncbi:hypothetical protein [Streptomyces wuyuanensis]|uniref:hypothetical protein n=1 Tax=Streptomyces wuyuanensis TaxID=1196353 RepID=UPI0034371EBE
MSPDEDDLVHATQAPVLSAAWAFAGAFWADRDLDAAWLYVDPLLRRCWAQMWLFPLLDVAREDGHDPEAVVEAFTADVPDHDLWPPFARTQLRHADLPVDRETWGVKVNPELIAPDIELVHLMPIPEGGVLYPGETRTAVPLLMRYEDGPGWRLLNFVSPAVPAPGWPPAMG